jgi:hypothetical protein
MALVYAGRRLSNTLDEQFCLEALAEALRKERLQIFNGAPGKHGWERPVNG